MVLTFLNSSARLSSFCSNSVRASCLSASDIGRRPWFACKQRTAGPNRAAQGCSVGVSMLQPFPRQGRYTSFTATLSSIPATAGQGPLTGLSWASRLSPTAPVAPPSPPPAAVGGAALRRCTASFLVLKMLPCDPRHAGLEKRGVKSIKDNAAAFCSNQDPRDT